MTFKTQIILASALLVVGIVGGFAISKHYHGSQVAKAEQEAKAAKEQAIADRALAEQKDKEAQAQKVRADAAVAQADISEAKFRKLAAQHTTPLPPLPPVIPPDCQPILERCQVAEAQLADANATIEVGKKALDDKNKAIGELKVQIADLGSARDLWKKTAEDERRRAACLEIALEAQKALTKGALWRGRLQGLAVGIGGTLLARR